ncbi:MAG: right-handed parallel beta-helix repeat-containing protein [Rikenellaceae bacterium]|jgi:hypothetical protein|nr:right-handed parallel beta-helix repeat-containing protein [Rikenellaceae bacterium]
MQKIPIRWPVLVLAWLLAVPLMAAEIWVSPNGSDRNPGTKEAPFQTLHAALRQARELRRLHDPSIERGVFINLQGGIYSLGETLLVRPEDSGTAESPTVVRAAAGENPVLSGGIFVKNWAPAKGNIPGLPAAARGKVWETSLPHVGNRPAEFRQLWVNNEKAVRARSAEPDKMDRMVSFDIDGRRIRIPAPEAPASWAAAPQLEMMGTQRWAVAFLRVKTVETLHGQAWLTFHEPESRIEFEHPWPQPVIDGEQGSSAFVLTNAIEFLDTPGEWYVDLKAEKIYYWPHAGEEMRTAAVIAPVLETLVGIAGTAARPVSHVHFEGIGFEHTGWTRPSQQGHVPLQTGMYILDAYKLAVPGLPGKPGLENQAWIGRPEAAVRVDGAEYINFEKCTFRHLASTGLDLKRAVKHASVTGCDFTDIGGTALLAGAFPDRGYETHVAWTPEFDGEICSGAIIRDNIVKDVANEDWGCVGVGVGYARDFTIDRNEVAEVPYSGISVGWGWLAAVNVSAGHRITANYIHDFARQLYDAGGIYILSAMPGTVIERNRIESIGAAPYATNDRAFYIYFDEASAYLDVHDNWMPEERYGWNQPGMNRLENNGPGVDPAIRAAAGAKRQPSD